MAIKTKPKPKKKTAKKKPPVTRKDKILQDIEDHPGKVHQIIQQNAQSLIDEDEDDTEHDDDEIHLSGPEYVRDRQRAEDEIVIDDLIQGIPKNQGYYLLLYRELSPNQYELKERIDHYHHWTDMEWEIASIVRRHTETNPRKWGSGRYRVQIKREKGLRGPKYDPLDFIIDAGDGMEPTVEKSGMPDAMMSAEAQLENMSRLMATVKDIMPQAQNPADVQNHMAQAFQQGLQLKIGDQSGAAQSNNQMMLMMMTMMQETFKAMHAKDVTPREDPGESLARTISMLKNMGLLPDPNVKKDDFMETMMKMKTMGIDPFHKDDPLKQINMVKSIAGLVGEFGGGPQERPGLAEKLVDAVVPVLPDIFNNIGKMSDNYTQLQMKGGATPQLIQPSPTPMATPPSEQPPHRDPTTPESTGPIHGGVSGGSRQEQPSAPEPPNEGGEQSMMVKLFFGKLKRAIEASNTEFFPELLRLMQQSPGGGDILQGLVSGQITKENLVILIQQWGGMDFMDPALQDRLTTYADMFVQYIHYQVRQQQQQQQTSEPPAHPLAHTNGHVPHTVEEEPSDVIIGRCVQCGFEYEFDTREDFINDGGHCDNTDTSGQVCNGDIVEITSN